MRAPAADDSDPSRVQPADLVEPRCRHAVACGGCDWQHVAYQAQLRLKRARVAQALASALGMDVPVVAATVGAPLPAETPGMMPWGFRRKAHFVFAQRGATLVMGHYRRGSRDVLPIDECPVHPDRANALAFVVRDALQRARVPAGPGGVVKHLVIRVSASRNEMLATLVVTRNDPSRLKRVMRDVMASPHAPAGWFLNIHPKQGALLFGDETLRLAGRERLREDIGGTAYLVSPGAFFQTNVDAAEALVQRVLDAVPDGARTVIDLYAGAGLFALPLARRGVRVIAVEESAAAVADGEASRALNRIGPDRCRFLVARAGDALSRNAVREARADAVVLDPPRIGAGEAVMRSLCDNIAPRRIVYVSCDADALGRDLAVASGRHGPYAIAAVTPVDMFPHTPHVETLAVLDRR
jgi:23S rRNA (uracil1939-C5)-methyltransferase